MQFSRPAYLILAWLGALAAGAAAFWRGRRLSHLESESAARETEFLRLLEESRHRIAELEHHVARVRETAADAESRFLGAFEQVAVGMNHLAPDGRYLRVNQRYCAITGYSPEDLLRLNVSAITHPDDVESDRRNMARLLCGECPSLTWEKRYIRKDGSLIWVNLTASAMRSPAGDAQYLVGVVEDVTARVNAQEALRQSEQRFRQLVEHAPFGMFVESGLEFRYMNRAAAAQFGASSPQQLAGAPVLDRVHAEDRGAVCDRSRQAAAGGDLPPAQCRFLRLDGDPFPAEVFPAPIVYDRQPAVLVLVRDRSAEERSEKERLQLEQRLHQAQKMESIGRLAGGVAHDFNNHLTVIGGYCDMLLDELSADDPLSEEVTQIRAAATRAATLTEQLLTFSRKQPSERKPLDLNSVVREQCRILERLLGDRIEVVPELASDLGAVNADRGQMQQVLMNLAINARDAMPCGGKLVFRTANVDPVVAENGVPPGPYVVLTVADTGKGMSPEILTDIFEPFFTTKPMGSGTGLGLSTVYGIVEQCGGYIRVASQPGSGAVFVIYLPREAAAPAQDERPRVLVIEDDAAVRGFLSELLADEGYEVHAVADGEAGLSEVERWQIGLVITDLVRPGRAGLETMRALRRRFPEVRIIAVCGAFDGEFLKAASRHGADATFQKPIDPNRLLPAVRTLLAETRT
jgi:PAS domain S-box-containing protein